MNFRPFLQKLNLDHERREAERRRLWQAASDFPPTSAGGTAAAAAVRRSGPLSNTGRKGRKDDALVACTAVGDGVAHIDYLTFTVPLGRSDQPRRLHDHVSSVDPTWLSEEGRAFYFKSLSHLFGIDTHSWKRSKSGFNGYTTKWESTSGAVVAYGGQHQGRTVHVSLPGAACAGCKDWQAVAKFGLLNCGRISRVDLAHDDHEGKDWNFERIEGLYNDGAFNAGGRPASFKRIESSTGRTFYIGKRENGKMLRGYEKGRELGDNDSKWFRVEGELRAKDRVIGWEVLTRPGQFLAGMYPALRGLSAVQDKVATIKRVACMELERCKATLQHQYGQLINLLLHVEGGDIESVFHGVSRRGTPKRFDGLLQFLQHTPPTPLAQV